MGDQCIFCFECPNRTQQNNWIFNPVYSKTTLILDRPRGFHPVVTMRATTEVYGGASTGQLHPGVIFRKHAEVNSDEDVIAVIKNKHEQSLQTKTKSA